MFKPFTKSILITTLVTVLLISACGPSATTEPTKPAQPTDTTAPTTEPEPTSPPEIVQLKASVLPFLSYAPFFIAQEEGFFAEQGLEVEFVRIDITAEAMPALAQGQIDVAAGFFDVSTLNAIAQGGNIKYVSDKGFLDPDSCSSVTWVARKDLLESGELDDLSNLEGMNIALTPTSSAEYALDLLLEDVGLSSSDVEILSIPMPARLEGLGSGSIDIAAVSEPWTIRMVNAGYGEVWNPWETYMPNFQFSIIMYGPNLLEKNPDVGVRYMIAYVKGVQQYNEGKTERNIEIISKYTGMEPEEVEQACWMPMKSDGILTMVGMQEFQEWAVAKGYQVDLVPEEQFVDLSFVETANETLK